MTPTSQSQICVVGNSLSRSSPITSNVVGRFTGKNTDNSTSDTSSRLSVHQWPKGTCISPDVDSVEFDTWVSLDVSEPTRILPPPPLEPRQYNTVCGEMLPFHHQHDVCQGVIFQYLDVFLQRKLSLCLKCLRVFRESV
jgi:hypothetical protein